MTVRELIVELLDHPLDAIVLVENTRESTNETAGFVEQGQRTPEGVIGVLIS